MAKYSIKVSDAATKSADAAHLTFNQNSPTTILKLYDFVIGSSDTVQDYSSRHDIVRLAADSTGGTSVTPVPLDGSSTASFVAVAEPSGFDSYSPEEILMYVPLNLRATFRYVCAPGSEFIVLAVDNAGIGDICGATTTAHKSDVTFLVEE